jgi:hypothetical protein
MNRLLVSSLLLLVTGLMTASAQPIVLFDRYELTGFLSPALSFSEIMGQSSYTLGGCAAVVIDHSTVIGIEGGGLISGVKGPAAADGARHDLQMFHAGLLLERIEQPSDPIHLVWRALIGGGELGYAGSLPTAGDYGARDAFLLFEPGAGVEFRAGEKVRIEVTALYRFIRGVQLEGFDRRDDETVVVRMMVKLGSF